MKDYIVSINYGRIKWINAIYMTAQLNNSYVYAYNSPSRWVDILDLRPGDVFYDIDDAIDDALAYTYSLVLEKGVEYGGCIYELFDPSYETSNKSRCSPMRYSYEEPYERGDPEFGSKYSFKPIERLGCIVYFHGHTAESMPGVSDSDIIATKHLWGDA